MTLSDHGLRRFAPHTCGVLPRVLLPRRRSVLMTVVALVCALTATGVIAARANANLSKCERFAAASVERGTMVTGSGERVVVIGDSWSAGLGLDRPGPVVAVAAARQGPRGRLLGHRVQREVLGVWPGLLR